MKVLQVNCVFQKGSTGKIVNDIHNCLNKQGFKSIVCYGRGFKVSDLNIYKFATEIEANFHNLLIRLGALQYGGMYFATNKLIKIIRSEKPDIVHLHCINGSSVNIYKILRYLGKNNIKTVITHHAEFFYTGSCGHAYDCLKWTKAPGCGKCPQKIEATHSRTLDRTKKAWILMKESFLRFDQSNLFFTAVSSWVKARSLQSPTINKFRCEVVENGLDTSIFNCKNVNKDILSQFDAQKKICLFVTASFNQNPNSIKGGYYLVQLARMLPDIQFVVAASYFKDTENLPNNVFFWGKTKDQKDLAQLYNIANVTVLTSRRETFSMVTAESLCCGTPIVGFEAGGPENIAIPEYSTFVEYGNLNRLRDELLIEMCKRRDKQTISRKAIERYSAEMMAMNYVMIYKQLTLSN